MPSTSSLIEPKEARRTLLDLEWDLERDSSESMSNWRCWRVISSLIIFIWGLGGETAEEEEKGERLVVVGVEVAVGFVVFGSSMVADVSVLFIHANKRRHKPLGTDSGTPGYPGLSVELENR